MNFTPVFIQFFEELAQNNHKEWFDVNRKIYETEVKEPFKVFVDKLITEIRNYEPGLVMRASDAIFRINRDIRFSKDKTPYKTHAGAYICARGKKDPSYPGLYVQLSAEGVLIASGVYVPVAETVADIRDYIAGNLDEFKKLYSDSVFVEKFGQVKGEKHKRVPSELKEAALAEPLLYNKQFYFEAELPPSFITSPDLLEVIMEYYQAAQPLNNFFKRVL
jgi:uncharacterized protein (TIGR02453 family)